MKLILVFLVVIYFLSAFWGFAEIAEAIFSLCGIVAVPVYVWHKFKSSDTESKKLAASSIDKKGRTKLKKLRFRFYSMVVGYEFILISFFLSKFTNKETLEATSVITLFVLIIYYAFVRLWIHSHLILFI